MEPEPDMIDMMNEQELRCSLREAIKETIRLRQATYDEMHKPSPALIKALAENQRLKELLDAKDALTKMAEEI